MIRYASFTSPHLFQIRLPSPFLPIHAIYLDLKVRKLAYPAATQNRFFRVQIAKDVHSGLFHHGEKVGVILGPLHVPHVLALELELLAVDLCTVGRVIQE